MNVRTDHLAQLPSLVVGEGKEAPRSLIDGGSSSRLLAGGKMRLRPYQERLVAACLVRNSVVLLPTGAGKTLIAIECMRQRRESSGPAVIFVPTIHLVAQQARAIRDQFGAEAVVCEYHGGAPLPASGGFDVLVSTPKAFERAQARNEALFKWTNFGTCIFDEVHHTTKKHPYHNLVQTLSISPRIEHTRIIGLTASLTYAVGQSKIEKAANQLCQALQVDQIVHASDAELLEGGYLSAESGATAELRLAVRPPPSSSDFSVLPRDMRQPHLMHSTFFDRVNQGKATRFAQELHRSVVDLESIARQRDPQFTSPLASGSLKSWGKYAKSKSRGGVDPLYCLLEDWYEALRLLVVSWEEDEDAVLIWLRMRNSPRCSGLPAEATAIVERFLQGKPARFERFENLFAALLEQYSSRGSIRAIVFVQQRIMTHIVNHAIQSNPETSAVIRATPIYSANAPATASLSLSKCDTKDALDRFRNGTANVLVATSVAEEGMDIPAANCVIRFDPVHTPVSFVQGRGRARQADSSFIVLAQREDRPVSFLAQQEVQQHAIATRMEVKVPDPDVDRKAQLNRTRQALHILTATTAATHLQDLNLYCQKTKALLTVSSKRLPGNHWEVVLTSTPRIRTGFQVVSASGSGKSKKDARKRAAAKLIQALIKLQQKSKHDT